MANVGQVHSDYAVLRTATSAKQFFSLFSPLFSSAAPVAVTAGVRSSLLPNDPHVLAGL